MLIPHVSGGPTNDSQIRLRFRVWIEGERKLRANSKCTPENSLKSFLSQYKSGRVGGALRSHFHDLPLHKLDTHARSQSA